jgi:hypothetical protein
MREERFSRQVHTGQAVLDIGEDIGALTIYTSKELHGREIEVSPVGNERNRTHTAVLERSVGGRSIFAALFLALPAGEYTLWGNEITPMGTVTITGGRVAEVDWSALTIPVPLFGPHTHNGNLAHILPPRYQGKVVSAAPMGAAPLLYDEEGKVAWDLMWSDFCDLALAGGPPHRGTLLEPVLPEEVHANEAAYERVVAEIERGLRLVTGLVTVRGRAPGWVGLVCHDEEMALWLLRAIIVENISVRREGCTLFFPAGPGFQLEKEIKNVITVVAKTHHYWTEHYNASSGWQSASCRQMGR